MKLHLASLDQLHRQGLPAASLLASSEESLQEGQHAAHHEAARARRTAELSSSRGRRLQPGQCPPPVAAGCTAAAAQARSCLPSFTLSPAPQQQHRAVCSIPHWCWSCSAPASLPARGCLPPAPTAATRLLLPLGALGKGL